MKTLIVQYTPRYEKSHVQKLLKEFRRLIKNPDWELLDLCVEPPEFFTVDSIQAYFKRNMQRQALSIDEQHYLDSMLKKTAQLKAADIVILAFPMFNFSLPAPVKAWFDSVLHVGETIDPGGHTYKGLMSGKKALILVASGGLYDFGNGTPPFFGPRWEHALSLARLEFEFMGYSDIRGVMLEGTAFYAAQVLEEKLSDALNSIRQIVSEWYEKSDLSD